MRHLILAPVLLLGVAGPAMAQEPQEGSHFGVIASFAPLWTTDATLISKFAPTVDEFDLRGSELRLGVIIRGRTEGGDWGVSFVRKNVSSSSQITVDRGNNCFDDNSGVQSCFQDNDWYRLRSGVMQGVEIHKFIPFATIKRRVQLGINLGGGVVTITGRAQKTSLRHDMRFDPERFEFVVTPIETTEMIDVEEFLREEDAPTMLPLIRAEASAAVLLTHGVKIRFGGGFNFPGYQKFSVGLIYLIGG